MTTEKSLRWLLFSALCYSLLLATSCKKTMDNEFSITANPEVLRRLKVNILYLDNGTNPLLTYYNKGEFNKYRGEVEGYVLYVNYNDVLFFRAQCDWDPEHFAYSKRKGITLEEFEGKIYANIFFLESQEKQERRYDSSTEMLSLEDAKMKYQNDFHPMSWREHLSLEKKFRLTFSP